MPQRHFIARSFLIGGGAVGFLGLVLWFALPIKSTFPPFLLTALLAIAYGLIGLKRRGKKIKA